MAEAARTIETIHTPSGVTLLVEKRVGDQQSEVVLHSETTRRCLLHWGMRREPRTEWQRPPPSCWPAVTTCYGLEAVETPFTSLTGERRDLTIRLGPHPAYSHLSFVLFFPDDRCWDNNQGRNYEVTVPSAVCPGLTVLKALRGHDDKEQILFESVLALEAQGQLAVAVTQGHKGYQVRLVSNLPGALTLHWGIACRSPSEWLRPPTSLHPPGTTLFEGYTAHTPFTFRDGFHRLGLDFLEAEAPLGIRFVLRQTDSGRWLNDHGKCFYVPVGQPQVATIDDGGPANLILHPGGRNK